MKKNSIFIVITSILLTISNILLVIFCMPSQIPQHINIFNNIDLLCSKWLYFINLPIIFILTLYFIRAKKHESKLFFKTLYLIFVFINTLTLVYYSIETSFTIESSYKIPLCLVTFLPLSILIIAWANILKTTPYKSWYGIKNKYSLETEFLWKQIHFSAQNKFFKAGIILLFSSLLFSLFNLLYVEIIIFFATIITANILLTKEAKSMWQKYIEMKNRKEANEIIKQYSEEKK